MSLNIKSAETHQMARELAQITGENITTAVTQAVRERLDREKKRKKKEGRLAWLLQLSKKTSALINESRSSKEIMDELYDSQTGLPV